MEMYEGRWVVTVKFPEKWGAYTSEDGRIKVGPDDNDPTLWYYCATNESIDLDEIIELVDETVKTNLEAIKKVELFKLKANELKKIFSDESLSFKKLQTLQFVFSDKIEETRTTKTETPKKTASKKDLISQVENVIQEHDVFTPEPVKETTPKKTRKQKQKQTEELQSVQATNMTQEEIDELRG